MGTVAVLIDSNILIDLLLGVPDAKVELSLYTDCAISMVTWIEVMAGAKPHEADAIRRYLKTFERLPLTVAVAEKAALARQEMRLKVPDAIIWATAQTTGRVLITRNTRDFSVDDPMIRVPYRI